MSRRRSRYDRTTLPNGLRLVTVEQPHLHRVALVLYCRAGSRYESARTNGLSHLVEHMLFRGSESLPTPYALNRAIESLGGTLNAATHADYVFYEIVLPPESVGAGLGILGEIASKPTFGGLATEKEIVREEILQDLDEDGNEVDVDNLSRQQIWPDHPLGYRISGSLANVARFSRKDLREHFGRHYVAENLVLCVSGAFSRAKVIEPVAEAFGRIPRGAPVGWTSPGNGQTGPVVEFIKNPGSQTELRVALRSLGERDADYVALVMLSRLLDDGMSTRLHRRICDEMGLAYEISAGLDTYDDVGLLDVAASVAPHKLVDVVAEILRLLKSLRDRAVDPEELDKAKRRYRWDLEATEDDIEGMAGWFGATELFHPPEPIEDRIRRIEAVTAEDLVRVADRVVEAKGLNVTVLGEVGRKDRARAERAVDRTLR